MHRGNCGEAGITLTWAGKEGNTDNPVAFLPLVVLFWPTKKTGKGTNMYLKVKRLLDIIFSFICLIVLLPIFVLLVIAIKLDSQGPIFFVQTRMGKNKRHFKMIKFRTMKIDAPNEVPTHLLGNPNKWLTKVGRFLRRTSLDELPQIWNILIG